MTKIISDAHILLSMTYVSRSKQEMTEEGISEILQQAQDNNSANAITGILVFKDNIFLQTVEGSRAQISHLLSSLIADQRHYDLQVLETRELTRREWSKWSMNYVPSTTENAATYLKYSTTEDFNPYLLSFEALKGLMKDLSD